MLKPGALFASYEWVATAMFDPDNAEHVRIMDDINYGNGLPVRHEGAGSQATQQPIVKALPLVE